MAQVKKILNYIKIDAFSATPKYQQLSHSILKGIQNEIIKKGDLMPSINEVSFEFNISRVTVEKGYNYLKSIGILGSVAGKGYFVLHTDYEYDLKIMLLFNKLSPHKKIIYDTFAKTLGEKAAIHFYIYNNDFTLFSRLLNQPNENYTHYVIIPHFLEGEENASKLIDKLPKEKLVILDKKIKGLSGEYAAVYENFEENIFNALVQAKEHLSKYHTLKLVFPENSYFPLEIIDGLVSFCQNFAFKHKIVYNIDEESVDKGEVFINLMEDDLVKILEKIITSELQIGQDIGIISYNETPLKKFIMKGLTTISTDFEAMGKSAANLILHSSKKHIENPFNLTLRGSL